MPLEKPGSVRTIQIKDSKLTRLSKTLETFPEIRVAFVLSETQVAADS